MKRLPVLIAGAVLGLGALAGPGLAPSVLAAANTQTVHYTFVDPPVAAEAASTDVTNRGSTT